MQYRVILPEKAKKDLQKTDNRYRPAVLAALVSLESNPYLGKKLEGKYQGLRSYRIWPYRIIYKIISKELIILIIRIGYRQGVY